MVKNYSILGLLLQYVGRVNSRNHLLTSVGNVTKPNMLGDGFTIFTIEARISRLPVGVRFTHYPFRSVAHISCGHYVIALEKEKWLYLCKLVIWHLLLSF